MMHKRIVSFLLLLCLLSALGWASAEEPAEQWLTEAFEESGAAVRALRAAAPVSGDCGEDAHWELDEAGTLTIRGSGAMKNSPDFGDKDRIRAVVIEEGITSVGASAFYSCKRLRSVAIPVSVAEVGASAFRSCLLLTEVRYGGTTAEWDALRFSGSSGLSNAAIHCTDGSIGLPQLAAPTDLSWGRNYGAAPQDGGEYTPWNGMISWAPGGSAGGEGRFRLLLCDADTDETLAYETWNNGTQHNGHLSTPFFLAKAERGGRYYCLVAELGDGTSCRTSEPVASPVWEYVQPEAALPPAEGLSLTRQGDGGLLAAWTLPEEPEADGLILEVYYAAEKGKTPQLVGRQTSLTKTYTERLLPGEQLRQIGEGFYSIRVRALSADITARASAQWSPLSEAVYVGDVEAKLVQILAKLGDGTDEAAREEALRAVRELDTPALAAALAADTNNSGVTAKLAVLEYRCGCRPAIEVKEPLSERLEPEKITAVGAGLNGDGTILRFGETSVKQVPNKSLVALDYFALSLWDAETGEELYPPKTELAVPVKVTIPLPVKAAAEPRLFRQLPGLSFEEIPLTVSETADGTRGTFVLTQLGEFMLARPWRPGMEWDLNEDGQFTAADAGVLFARLSEGTAAPELDADGDGRVNSRDAVFLFRQARGRW